MHLAQQTGFIQAWISHVEHGRRNPSWSNVVRLATGLGCLPVVPTAIRLVALIGMPGALYRAR
jgi:predicted transcriptional regulator